MVWPTWQTPSGSETLDPFACFNRIRYACRILPICSETILQLALVILLCKSKSDSCLKKKKENKMIQINDQILFHLLLFESHSKVSPFHQTNKWLLTPSLMFNKLNLPEIPWDSHFVETSFLDSSDRNINTCQDKVKKLQTKHGRERGLFSKPMMVWKHPASTGDHQNLIAFILQNPYANMDSERMRLLI